MSNMKKCPKCGEEKDRSTCFSSKGKYCKPCANIAVKESRIRKKNGLPPPKMAKKVADPAPKTAENTEKVAKMADSVVEVVPADYEKFSKAVSKIVASLDKSKNFAELTAKLFAKMTLKMAKEMQNPSPAIAAPAGLEGPESESDDGDGSDGGDPEDTSEEKSPDPVNNVCIAQNTADPAEPAEPASPAQNSASPSEDVQPEPEYSAPEIVPTLESDSIFIGYDTNNVVFVGKDEETVGLKLRTKVDKNLIMPLLAEAVEKKCKVVLIGDEIALSDDVIAFVGGTENKIFTVGKYIQFYHTYLNKGQFGSVDYRQPWSIIPASDDRIAQLQKTMTKVDAAEYTDPRCRKNAGTKL